MTDQVKRICDLCKKESDHFEICLDCKRVVCLKCITTRSGIILKVDRSPKCPRCGSGRVFVYKEGMRVPQ